MLKYLIVVTFVFLPLRCFADSLPYFVQAYPKVCQHGLHEQPKKDFSVFLICDDALGSNICVVVTRPGVGPVEGEFPYKWGMTKRFWQCGNETPHIVVNE